jgi:hypothetical protein
MNVSELQGEVDRELGVQVRPVAARENARMRPVIWSGSGARGWRRSPRGRRHMNAQTSRAIASAL